MKNVEVVEEVEEGRKLLKKVVEEGEGRERRLKNVESC